jgi:methyl-accepting chemotaxis protein
MDDVTQQNAALVEEASSASRSLQDQADGLARLVGEFHLSNATAQHQSLAKPAQALAALPRKEKPGALSANEADWQSF